MGKNFEHLRVISACPICNARYHAAELKILDEHNDAQLVHITCRKCQSSVVAVVLVNPLGVSSIGLVTDLSGEEVLKFRQMSAISSDDVLDVHQVFRQPEVCQRLLGAEGRSSDRAA